MGLPENAKDRVAARSLPNGAYRRPHMRSLWSVPGRSTDSEPVAGVCAPGPHLCVIASPVEVGADEL